MEEVRAKETIKSAKKVRRVQRSCNIPGYFIKKLPRKRQSLTVPPDIAEGLNRMRVGQWL